MLSASSGKFAMAGGTQVVLRRQSDRRTGGNGDRGEASVGAVSLATDWRRVQGETVSGARCVTEALGEGMSRHEQRATNTLLT